MHYSVDKSNKRGNIYVRSNDIYFKNGLIELARNYFIAPNKVLYIIETNTFSSKSHMKHHLEVMKGIKYDFLVMVSGYASPGNQYAWFLNKDAPLARWIESLDTMNFFAPNIDSIIATCDKW